MTCHHTFNQAPPIAVTLVFLDLGSCLISGFVWKRSLMPSATPTLPFFWVSDTSGGTHLWHIHYSPSARNALASDFCMIDFFLVIRSHFNVTSQRSHPGSPKWQWSSSYSVTWLHFSSPHSTYFMWWYLVCYCLSLLPPPTGCKLHETNVWLRTWYLIHSRQYILVECIYKFYVPDTFILFNPLKIPVGKEPLLPLFYKSGNRGK